MNRDSLRRGWVVGAALLGVGTILCFPRVLAFAELAARELRYLWWLVLLVAVGAWLTFFVGSSKD